MNHVKIQAKKRFGQHFLVNPKAIERIVDALDLSAQDPVLEIGPGQGALTRLLARQAEQVVAVEADRDCVQFLRANLGDIANLHIVPGDFLKKDIGKELGSNDWKVVGNLPYNVASMILLHIFKYIERFCVLVLMFQSEVAQRIVSPCGSREFGFLSVAAQFFTQPKVVFRLGPGSFSPRPKVRSAVVRFEPRTRLDRERVDNPWAFLGWVDGFFVHRRKKLFPRITVPPNSDLAQRIFKRLRIPQGARPEDVSVEQWIELYVHLHGSLSLSP